MDAEALEIVLEDVAEIVAGDLADKRCTAAERSDRIGQLARVFALPQNGSAVIEENQLLFYSSSASEQEGNRAADLVSAEQLRGNPAADDAFVQGHLRQYRDIVDAIREGRPPAVRVADALRALAVIRALYVSATLGRTVRIAEVLDGSLDDVEVRTGGAS